MEEFKQLTFESFLDSYKKPRMGIPTGLQVLDDLIFGFNKGCLYMVGGSSGMGKTAIFIDFILAAAKKVPVGFISMEMTTQELQERMVCRVADINSQKLKAGKLTLDEKNEIQKAIKVLNKLHTISIAESTNCFYPTWVLEKRIPDDSIEALIADWSSKGCKIFFLDYLQMSELSEKVDREDIKVKRQCEKLKKLAKEHKVAIVAAAQLSGSPDERLLKGEDPKPVMRDLWGSVFIRATADVIMLLYREEYYQKKDQSSLFGKSTEEALICVPKLRSGPSQEELPVLFKPYCCSFVDRDSQSESANSDQRSGDTDKKGEMF